MTLRTHIPPHSTRPAQPVKYYMNLQSIDTALAQYLLDCLLSQVPSLLNISRKFYNIFLVIF